MTDLAQAEKRILELEAEVDRHKERRQHFEDLLNRSIEHENEWTQRALKAEQDRDRLLNLAEYVASDALFGQLTRLFGSGQKELVELREKLQEVRRG